MIKGDSRSLDYSSFGVILGYLGMYRIWGLGVNPLPHNIVSPTPLIDHQEMVPVYKGAEYSLLGGQGVFS